MNYYDEIYSKVKDYSKERHRVITYFEIGKLLNEAGKHYGENIIKEYSKKLIIEVGKKYSDRTLRRMRQLCQIFNNEKWSPLVTKLTWSHYIILMSIEDLNKIEYYLNLTISLSLSKRQLELKIKSKE